MPLHSVLEEEELEDFGWDIEEEEELQQDSKKASGTLCQLITETARRCPSRRVTALRAPTRPERLWELERLLRKALWPK